MIAKVPKPARNIKCACGKSFDANQVGPNGSAVDGRRTNAETARRLAICKHCDQWLDHRCKSIDLGCRIAYSAALHAIAPVCPEEKWLPAAAIKQVVHWSSIRVLNLLYHVCPLKTNDVWRANVRQVVRRLSIFNGRKVVAIATGDNLHGVDVVRQSFGDPTIVYLEIPNDPELREVATLLPLLEAAESTDPEEASFYAHTKGNSTADNALGAEFWRNAMYHHLLDHVNICRDLLLTHPCVGTHKMRWQRGTRIPFPSQLDVGDWMFSGTFFWFRHSEVYSHPKWRDIPRDRYGAEAWLSTLFSAEQAATVFQPWPASEYPIPSPYDPRLYLWPIRDS